MLTAQLNSKAWQHYARPHNVTNSSISLSWFNNNDALGVDNGTHFTTGLELLLSLPPSNTSTTTRALKYLSDPSDPIFADSQGSLSRSYLTEISSWATARSQL